MVAADSQGQPKPSVTTVSALVADSVAMRRFIALLLATFAASTLAIMMVGMFALIATVAEARASEFGVRLALGAPPVEVLRLLLRDAAQLAAAGSVVGVLAAAALTRVIRSQLYGVGPTDVPTMLAVVAVLVAGIALACAVPARRTARLDPADAIRRTD